MTQAYRLIVSAVIETAMLALAFVAIVAWILQLAMIGAVALLVRAVWNIGSSGKRSKGPTAEGSDLEPPDLWAGISFALFLILGAVALVLYACS